MNAVISGASKGIGSAIARELAKNGENLALLYNTDIDGANELARELKSTGVRVFTYQCDVADFDACKQVYTQIKADLGGADILINNAGQTKDNLMLRMSYLEYSDIVDINLKSVFNLTKQFLPDMLKKRYGRIINITSVAGIRGNAGQVNYSSAKAGVIGFTKSLAREVAARNITVNAIAPGFITTAMTQNLNDEFLKKATETIPMHRLGTPAEVAHLAAFLASPHASYITGEVIRIDGGLGI